MAGAGRFPDPPGALTMGRNMLKASRNHAIALRILHALAPAPAATAAPPIKPYVRDDLASDVVRLAETVRKETAQIGRQGQGQERRALRKEAAAAATAGDYKGASKLLGAAIAGNPKDAAAWLLLAKLARKPTTRRPPAATISSSAARPPPTPPISADRAAPQQAEALALLGDLFARHEMWRPSLDAYRASLDRRDDADMRKTYEDLREKHGFRIVDYKVDNESAAPRVCFNFSEPLARKTDFAPYVAVAGAANARDSRRRPADLRRGRSSMASDTRSSLREGLPSAVGETLLKTPTTRSMCATARRRRISPARLTSCRARASTARR